MSAGEDRPPVINLPDRSRRRAVGQSPSSLVRMKFLDGDRELPLVVYPAVKGMDLAAWIKRSRDSVETNLCKYGAILFRGFAIKSAADFEQVVTAVSSDLLEYRERSSPRTQVSGNIYSSTDYPADQSIFLHNENSYQTTWPLKIFFFCQKVAQEGGETPIADCRRVLARIDIEVRKRFWEKGWMYVRNFGKHLGLDWPSVFGTTEKAEVEAHCRNNAIEFEWRPGDRLRTRARRQAIARHPRTNELTWFNHAAFFHSTTLEPTVHDILMKEFDEEDLPTHTYYGDGSPIEPAVLDHLRESYRQELVAFPWNEDDILLLENMLVAHGRRPYTGERKVLVAMCEPFGHYGTDKLVGR
jgi:alpha-ketoglutarate-dependent taurine dioxygenase